MLLNHLTMAWKVLLRRKFFTLLSLVGIGATLMSLLMAVALYDAAAGPHPPETHPDRLLTSTMMTLDMGGGPMHMRSSQWLLSKALAPVRAQATVGIASLEPLPVVAYVQGRKLPLNVKAADAGFWQVLDFQFLEGGPYTAGQRGEGIPAVISAHTARAYFGAARGVVGRTLVIDQKNYRVLGVVADVPAVRFHAHADVWVPFDPGAMDMQADNAFGTAEALVLARSPEARSAVAAAFQQGLATVPVDKGMTVDMRLEPFAESVAGRVLAQYNWTQNPARLFRGLSAGAVLLLLLLPALNLVTMNVSRLRERATEIGVRKAFGATAQALAGQFLVETLVLTLLGGVLGLLLATAVLHGLGAGYLATYGRIEPNLTVFGWALLGSLVFGLLSGAYPAWRLARLPAVEALRSAP
jgi:putative ABC transport system permease protein